MKNVIDDPSLYRRFKYHYIKIGSTTYRIIQYSDLLATVFIKTDLDSKYRSLQDFFGDTAYADAFAWASSQANN